jgi:purine-binding chemotaxis protein CheW
MLTVTSQFRKFLIFSLRDELYALDLELVAEVSDPPQIWPIPLAPACYSGALNFHGDIVAVIDLALFLGLSGCSQPKKLIILNRKVASLAFLVDTVAKIVPEGEILTSPPPDNIFSAATLSLQDGKAILLDLEALVRAAEDVILKKL